MCGCRGKLTYLVDTAVARSIHFDYIRVGTSAVEHQFARLARSAGFAIGSA